jgi:hypothetical protein
LDLVGHAILEERTNRDPVIAAAIEADQGEPARPGDAADRAGAGLLVAGDAQERVAHREAPLGVALEAHRSPV